MVHTVQDAIAAARRLGAPELPPGGGAVDCRTPVDGSVSARLRPATRDQYDRAVAASRDAFLRWRVVPAPRRGEIVHEIGQELRRHKDDLGLVVSLETGKILAEGRGEVQEMIDIALFAAGLSRQLHGLSMHSERSRHRMYEQWHPLGPVGVITAFNFPVAVWSWNALIAAVCGDTVVWKPSPQTPLCSEAVMAICRGVTARHGFDDVFTMVPGGAEVGAWIADDRAIPLVSATGSCAMGRHVGRAVAARLGRSLLELGGNNAVVVMDDADLALATRAIVFGAVGTAGQRCTSIRRLLVHRAVAGELTDRLLAAYRTIRVGSPFDPATLMGPLVSLRAVEAMRTALATIREQGGEVLLGGGTPGGCYVEPTLVKVPPGLPAMQEEVFAPILYIVEVDSLEDAIQWNNAVPQGLSSAIFTRGLVLAERFLGHEGSDCGIANVNIGTSGAEIGGAFGGEKDTGGGREAGSDAWKSYMRRQTVTINWSPELPLAQGIEFPA